MLRFRESFRGYNKDDVNSYIEQINLLFSRKEGELRAYIANLEMSLATDPATAPTPAMPMGNEGDGPSLDELKAKIASLEEALARVEEEKKTLASLQEKTSAEKAESDEKSKLYDTMSAQVGNILIVANTNADKILDDAKKEASRLINEAILEAEHIRSEAESEARERLASVQAKIRRVSDNCLAEYKALLDEADNSFRAMSAAMSDRASTLLGTTVNGCQELSKKISEDYGTQDTVSANE